MRNWSLSVRGGLAAMALLIAAGTVHATDAPAKADAAAKVDAAAGLTAVGPTTRPLLEELNRETQTLFQQVAPSVARVELPWRIESANTMTDPLAKWAGRIDPQTLQRLMEIERGATPDSCAVTEIRPSTQPSPAQPSSAEQPQPQRPRILIMPMTQFTPNAVGVVLDSQGHLLVPRYVEKEAFAAAVPVMLGDGRIVSAGFVASDRQSDVTILKLPPGMGAAATLASGRPAEGTLLLVVSLNPGANRLAVWQGWQPDFATLINIDGTIAGFSKGGRFLSAGACEPVARELIEHGSVRRARLGVAIVAVLPSDPQRQSEPGLGAAPALRVLQVMPGSAAQHAGLAAGDLILAMAGQAVGDAPTFAAAIAARRGPTQMVVLRDGKRLVLTVDLEAP